MFMLNLKTITEPMDYVVDLEFMIPDLRLEFYNFLSRVMVYC